MAGGSWTSFFSVYIVHQLQVEGFRQVGRLNSRTVCERQLKGHVKNRGESREEVDRKSMGGEIRQKERQRTARTRQKGADKGRDKHDRKSILPATNVSYQ